MHRPRNYLCLFSNTRIFQHHKDLHKLQQGDLSVAAYLNKAKNIFDSLVAVERPMFVEDLNLHIFKGLYYEFKDPTSTLNAYLEPVSFYDLQALLHDNEFINDNHIAPPTTHFSTI